MDEVNVIIRPFIPHEDEAMIYASWRNSSFYSAFEKPKEKPTNYFRQQTAKIKEILKSADVKIACLQDAPMVIVGYSVSRGTHLDWIFVKVDYRNKGIGALLFAKNIQTVTNHITKIGAILVKKKNLKIGEE